MNRIAMTVCFVCLLAFAVAFEFDSTAAKTAPKATWTQWRGPSRDGQIVGNPWPDKLSGDAVTQRWRVTLAPSYSGPIVSETAVFVTETKDQSTEIVRALDRNTGKELWKAEWPGAISVPFFAKKSGDWIRSTPTFDGQSLYVAGMRDVLVSLNAKTGKEQWRIDFVKQLNAPLPEFGFICSPLLDGEFLYVQAGNATVKLKKSYG